MGNSKNLRFSTSRVSSAQLARRYLDSKRITEIEFRIRECSVYGEHPQHLHIHVSLYLWHLLFTVQKQDGVRSTLLLLGFEEAKWRMYYKEAIHIQLDRLPFLEREKQKQKEETNGEIKK